MIIDIILITSSLLFFADFFLLNYLWLNFCDKLYDIFYVLLLILLILTAVFGIIKIFVVMFKSKSKISIRIISIGLIIALFVGAGTTLSSMTKSKYVGSFTYISEKETDENDNCFLVIMDSELNKYIRVKCDKDTYNKIETGENNLYTVEYRIGCLNTDYGVLENISK